MDKINKQNLPTFVSGAEIIIQVSFNKRLDDIKEVVLLEKIAKKYNFDMEIKNDCPFSKAIFISEDPGKIKNIRKILKKMGW
jgi:hypothetical protein